MEGTQKRNAAKKRRSRRPKSARAYEHYFVHVESWEHYYGFGAGDPRFDELPYRHTETVTWTGPIILPENFKFPRATVTLSARHRLLNQDAKASPIGINHGRSGVLNAHVFVPAEHMAQLVSMASSGRVKEISFLGNPLFRGQGLIRSISLSTETDDDLNPE